MRSIDTLKLSYRRLNMSGTSVSPIVVGDTNTDSSDNDELPTKEIKLAGLPGSPLKVICSEQYRSVLLFNFHVF